MTIIDKKFITYSPTRYMLIFFCILLLSGCNYQFTPKPVSNIKVELATQSVEAIEFNQQLLESLSFNEYIYGEKVEFSESHDSIVFRITKEQNLDKKHTLLVMPHYLRKVVYFDENLKIRDEFVRNLYTPYREYSPNTIAFDDIEDISYVVIENKVSKSIHFSIENQNYIKAYDQKLLMTFTVVYSIVLTLVFMHLVFYFFIKRIGYLLYSIYIFSVLFSLLFQEGMIAYFPTLSYPIFGVYTQVVWLKLTSILYWLFTLYFLDLKNRSKFDYKFIKIMLAIECIIVASILLLSIFKVSSFFLYVVTFINLSFIISLAIAIYIPIKYALQNVRQARYLAVGVVVHVITAMMRVKYSSTLEPLAFWMPRAIEFGLLFEALILSFGLADRTMRITQQRDIAERKVKLADRELFCKELEKSFQQRAINTIDKYYGTQAQLNNMINSYFISSLQQLVEVKDAFYVAEDRGKVDTQFISSTKADFDIGGYIQSNSKFIRAICTSSTASYQENQSKEFSQLPFVIIPIQEKDFDNLCLFLTFPTYVAINANVIRDLYIFANSMTIPFLTVKKYQKTIGDSRLDNLTKVFNRKTVQTKLDRLVAKSNPNKQQVAVAFIDIDDFKAINDSYGHEAGDKCLVFLCQKLNQEFNYKTFVGRYGGDEFVVVFNQYQQSHIEDKLKIFYEYLATHPIKDIDITLKISIGVALNSNHHVKSGKQLLQIADAALYRAKANGKNQFIID